MQICSNQQHCGNPEYFRFTGSARCDRYAFRSHWPMIVPVGSPPVFTMILSDISAHDFTGSQRLERYAFSTPDKVNGVIEVHFPDDYNPDSDSIF